MSTNVTFIHGPAVAMARSLTAHLAVDDETDGRDGILRIRTSLRVSRRESDTWRSNVREIR